MQEFKEYSKISIHNHFGDKLSEKTKDDSYDKEIKFNYIAAFDKIKKAAVENFNLLAFTNSNVILVPQYLALKKYASLLNINLVPGIEINIINEAKDRILHLVIIFDPKTNLFRISEKINKYINDNKAIYINICQLVDIILEEKVILIPHGIKQTKYDRSSADNPEQFKEIISMRNAIPIIIEDNKVYHRETLILRLKEKLNKDELAWIQKGSSVSCADRQEFDKIEEPTYIWVIIHLKIYIFQF